MFDYHVDWEDTYGRPTVSFWSPCGGRGLGRICSRMVKVVGPSRNSGMDPGGPWWSRTSGGYGKGPASQFGAG